MKVWIVLYHSPEEDEGTWLDRVYSSKEKAEERVKRIYFASVEEAEVDAEVDEEENESRKTE